MEAGAGQGSVRHRLSIASRRPARERCQLRPARCRRAVRRGRDAGAGAQLGQQWLAHVEPSLPGSRWCGRRHPACCPPHPVAVSKLRAGRCSRRHDRLAEANGQACMRPSGPAFDRAVQRMDARARRAGRRVSRPRSSPLVGQRRHHLGLEAACRRRRSLMRTQGSIDMLGFAARSAPERRAGRGLRRDRGPLCNARAEASFARPFAQLGDEAAEGQGLKASRADVAVSVRSGDRADRQCRTCHAQCRGRARSDHRRTGRRMRPAAPRGRLAVGNGSSACASSLSMFARRCRTRYWGVRAS